MYNKKISSLLKIIANKEKTINVKANTFKCVENELVKLDTYIEKYETMEAEIYVMEEKKLKKGNVNILIKNLYTKKKLSTFIRKNYLINLLKLLLLFIISFFNWILTSLGIRKKPESRKRKSIPKVLSVLKSILKYDRRRARHLKNPKLNDIKHMNLITIWFKVVFKKRPPRFPKMEPQWKQVVMRKNKNGVLREVWDYTDEEYARQRREKLTEAKKARKRRVQRRLRRRLIYPKMWPFTMGHEFSEKRIFYRIFYNLYCKFNTRTLKTLVQWFKTSRLVDTERLMFLSFEALVEVFTDTALSIFNGIVYVWDHFLEVLDKIASALSFDFVLSTIDYLKNVWPPYYVAAFIMAHIFVGILQAYNVYIFYRKKILFTKIWLNLNKIKLFCLYIIKSKFKFKIESAKKILANKQDLLWKCKKKKNVYKADDKIDISLAKGDSIMTEGTVCVNCPCRGFCYIKDKEDNNKVSLKSRILDYWWDIIKK